MRTKKVSIPCLASAPLGQTAVRPPEKVVIELLGGRVLEGVDLHLCGWMPDMTCWRDLHFGI
jgi:hypothetical protein